MQYETNLQFAPRADEPSIRLGRRWAIVGGYAAVVASVLLLALLVARVPPARHEMARWLTFDHEEEVARALAGARGWLLNSD